MDFHKGRLDSIQALRGITALFIILEHVRVFNCGAFGVDIFFCISGFIIMYSTHANTEHFLSKRLIRILPLYYLFTLFTFLIMVVAPGLFEQSKATIPSLVKSLLFIPFDIGGGVIQPLMRVGWTVNCEIFFYLIFFLSLKCSHKYRGLIASILVAAVVLLNTLLPSAPVPLQFYGNPVMLDFIWGILAYYTALAIHKQYVAGKLPKWISYIAFLPVAILFFLLMITKQGINVLGFRRPLLWGIPAFIIFLCFYTAGLHLKFRREFVTLGDISFSVYLVHYYPVMFLDRKVFDFSVFSVSCILGTALAIAISIVLAQISYGLIEKQFCGFLRRKLITKK